MFAIQLFLNFNNTL